MNPPIQPNDLIVASVAEREDKTMLIRAYSVKGDVIRGAIEKNRHMVSTEIEVPVSSLIINLGQDPKPGRVYGHDLSYLFRRYRSIPYLNDVAFFCRVNKEQIQQLKAASVSLQKRLAKAKLDFILDDDITYEVVSKEYAGKWAGMYSRSKVENQPHKIQITLDKSRLETSSIANYEYVLAHELGHHIHFHYVKATSVADAAWIRAYQDTVRPLEVEPSMVATFLERLIQERSVRALIAETEEDLKPHLKRVLKEVRSSAGLGPRELDRLLEVQKDSHVEKSWPQSGLMLSEKHPSVTEYALKNYNELFAESFAFHILGREIPKKIASCMESSLSLARSQPRDN